MQRSRVCRRSARRESLLLVEQLARALDEVRYAQVPLAMAFEWPRRADGWKVRALQSVLQGLNVR
eukprot:1726210-Heterocapsa_arctica.AAC.1